MYATYFITYKESEEETWSETESSKDFFGKDMVEQTPVFFIPAWAI